MFIHVEKYILYGGIYVCKEKLRRFIERTWETQHGTS